MSSFKYRIDAKPEIGFALRTARTNSKEEKNSLVKEFKKISGVVEITVNHDTVWTKK